eukprot:12912042-Alexandrium_andersonii.AAC.1
MRRRTTAYYRVLPCTTAYSGLVAGPAGQVVGLARPHGTAQVGSRRARAANRWARGGANSERLRLTPTGGASRL